MLRDTPVDFKVNTRPKPLTARQMIPWLERQSGSYDPNKPHGCPLHRWLLSRGYDPDTAYHLAFWIGEARDFGFLFDQPFTYEAALERAREHDH